MVIPLIGLMIFIGVYPKPLLDRIEPSVRALMVHVERQVPGFREPGPEREGEVGPLIAEERDAEADQQFEDEEAGR